MTPGTSVDVAVGNDAQRTSSLLTAAVRAAKSDKKALPKGIGADTAAAFDDYVGEMTGPLLELYSAPLLTSTQLLDTYRNERPI